MPKSLFDYADHKQYICPWCHGIETITITDGNGEITHLPIVEWIDHGIALDASCICS